MIYSAEAQTTPPPLQCDPLNVVNDDNRDDPIYLDVGDTFTMTSHADWNGANKFSDFLPNLVKDLEEIW